MNRMILFVLLLVSGFTSAKAAQPAIAIITHDQVALRSGPRDSAKPHAVLWQGEAVEVRGERMDYVQVYDYRRERGGFVRASQLRRLALTPEEAPELLAVVRHLRGTPGAEALGIGFTAAYLLAAPAETLNGADGIQALDALGTFAERLAQRASSGTPPNKAAQALLSAHLDVAARYGINFVTHERDGRLQLCYDGDAFRRVLAMNSSAEQRARAALALTRPECAGSEAKPLERKRVDEWRAEVLDRVEVKELPAYLKNRVLMRRASLWASLAFQRARMAGNSYGDAATAPALRAIAELGGVVKSELTDDDLQAFRNAAMRVNVSRWAAIPARETADAKRPHVVTAAGEPGQTCILLLDAKHDLQRPLIRRCTYGLVWTGSASLNREGNTLALAVQPTDSWSELWIFRRTGNDWTVRVLPPATTLPDVGYAEFAGWVPGGAQMLVAREALGEGKYRRKFELLRLDTLSAVRQASDPAILGAFQRWQDPAWKQASLSVR